MARADDTALDWDTWQHIPVFAAERVMSLDTFARTVVRQICGRENPTLDLAGAIPGKGSDAPELAEARLLFPDGRPRKFSAAELLFSWLVEPERWGRVPLFVAEHETLRKDLLKLPTADEHGRRLRRVSLQQLRSTRAFWERWAEIAGAAARAAAAEKEPELSRIDKLVKELSDAQSLFRGLTFRPAKASAPQSRFSEKSEQLLGTRDSQGRARDPGTWDRVQKAIESWDSLEQQAPSIARLDEAETRQSLLDETATVVDELEAICGQEELDVQTAEPAVLALRRATAALAKHFADHEQRVFSARLELEETVLRDARDQAHTLAGLTAELARLAVQLHLGLYENVWPEERKRLRVLRVVPPSRLLGSDTAAQSGDVQPWLALQTLLYGSKELLADYPQPELQQVQEAFREAAAIYRDGDYPHRSEAFAAAMERFAAALHALGEQIDPALYPPPGATNLEVRYNRSNPFLWSWVASLGALALFALGFGVIRRPMFWIGMAVLLFAEGMTVYGMVLRGLISGWTPLTNMFESVIFVALCAAVLGTWFVVLPLLQSGLKQAWHLSAIPNTWEACGARGAQGSPAEPQRWSAFTGSLVALRAILACVTVAMLCVLPLGPGGRGPIVPLLPRVAIGSHFPTLNDLLVWIVGWCILLPSVWYVPRLVLAALLGTGTVPRTLDRQNTPELLQEVLARKPFVMVGSGVSFVAAYLAYFAPVFSKDIPSPTPALRDNFWLIIHVLPTMASYAAGALAWGLGNIALGYYLFGRYGDDTEQGTGATAVAAPQPCASLAKFTYKAMQVAVLLLIAGTILGALWADVAWGSLWQWDRKEVWALVSILVYMVVLHARSARWLGDFGLVFGAVLGFTAIVVTWYGLNYILPGGLHSYGRGEGGMKEVGFVVLCNWLFLTAAAVRYRLASRPPKAT